MSDADRLAFAAAPGGDCSGRVWPAADALLDELRRRLNGLRGGSDGRDDGAALLRLVELGAGTGFVGLELARMLGGGAAVAQQSSPRSVALTLTEMDGGPTQRLVANLVTNAARVGLQRDDDGDVVGGDVQHSGSDPRAPGCWWRVPGGGLRLRAVPLDWGRVVARSGGGINSGGGSRKKTVDGGGGASAWAAAASSTLARELGKEVVAQGTEVDPGGSRGAAAGTGEQAEGDKGETHPQLELGAFDALVGSDLCYSEDTVTFLVATVAQLLREARRPSPGAGWWSASPSFVYAHTVGRWGASGFDATLWHALQSAGLRARPVAPSATEILRKDVDDWLPTAEGGGPVQRVVVFEISLRRTAATSDGQQDRTLGVQNNDNEEDDDDDDEEEMAAERVLLHAVRCDELAQAAQRASMTEAERDEADACAVGFSAFFD